MTVLLAALFSAVAYAAELPCTAASEAAPTTAVVEGAVLPESGGASEAESPAENAASSAETRSPPQTTGAERTTLNLLGEVDSSSGESRRNENVEITLIDNNVLKELNIRMGTKATIIQEFDADKGYFGREFGGEPSRQVHLAPSRASRLHGNLYESHNNSLFSARSFFQIGDVKPARVNDYGFQLGSPLWRGANFSVDGSQQRNRGSVNGNVLVPRPDERTPLATDPETRAFVSRILESYPDTPPNRTDINPRALNTNAPQEIDNDAAGARLDQALSGSDALLASYRFKTQKVEGFQLVKGQNPDTTTRSHDARITWSRIWSAATISDFSAGFDRVTSLIVRDETALGPSISAGRELQSLGGTSSVPFDRAQNRFRYAGLLRHTRGRHFWTAGFEVLREQLNGVESSGHVGSSIFRTDFLDEAGHPRDTITNLRLGTPSLFFKGIGNTHRGFRSWRMQYFLGDQWKPNSSLTLNFSLRYQPATPPWEVNRLSERSPITATATTSRLVSVSLTARSRVGVSCEAPTASTMARSSLNVHAGAIQSAAQPEHYRQRPGSDEPLGGRGSERTGSERQKQHPRPRAGLGRALFPSVQLQLGTCAGPGLDRAPRLPGKPHASLV